MNKIKTLLLSLIVFAACDTSIPFVNSQTVAKSNIDLYVDNNREEFFPCNEISAYRVKDTMCVIAFGNYKVGNVTSSEKRFNLVFDLTEFKIDSGYMQLPAQVILKPGARIYDAVMYMDIHHIDGILVDGYIEADLQEGADIDKLRFYFDRLQLNM